MPSPPLAQASPSAQKKQELHIPQGTVMQEPIELTFTEPVSRLHVIIEKGAHVAIIETLEGRKMDHEVVLTIGKNAKVDFVSLQNADPDAEVKIQQKSILEENSSVHWHNATLGGSIVSHDLVSHLIGEKSESNIDWIFYGKGTEKQNLRARNIFDAAEGRGDITVKGVAEGKAHAVFNGMIEITKHGNGTNTYLTETTLMLDPTAKVDAIPALEIKTNDVKASHSATITKVSEEDLFYFASRGVAKNDARKMYVLGFLGALVHGCQQHKIDAAILSEIERKYDDRA